jgi:hypothetical protein
MHEAILLWVEHAEPHPDQMGGFFKSVLTNDLVGACSHADAANAMCLKAWALFLYNDVPSPCWGSEEKLQAWYVRHHLKEGAD